MIDIAFFKSLASSNPELALQYISDELKDERTIPQGLKAVDAITPGATRSGLVAQSLGVAEDEAVAFSSAADLAAASQADTTRQFKRNMRKSSLAGSAAKSELGVRTRDLTRQ